MSDEDDVYFIEELQDDSVLLANLSGGSSTAMKTTDVDLRHLHRIDIKFGVELVLLGAGLLLLSHILSFQLPFYLRNYYWISLGLSALGVSVFILGASVIESGRLPRWLSGIASKLCGWLGVSVAQLFLLFMSIPFVIVATIASGFEEKMIDRPIALISWGIAIVLVVSGGRGKEYARFHPNWRDAIPVIVIFLIAILVRVTSTAQIPDVLSGDEASSGLYSARFAHGEVDNIFTVGWFSFPTFYFFIQSIFISMLGQTTAALRIPSALVGALTVLALFYVGRAMYGYKIGLLAAAILACLHYHINFSRIGLNNIWDGLFYIIVLGAFWHGWKYTNRSSFVLAGLGLGFSQYFYTSSRMLFAIIPLFLLIAGIIDFKHFKRIFPYLILMGLVTLIVVLPLAWLYVMRPTEFMAPMQRVSIFGAWMKNEASSTGLPAWVIVLRQIGLGFLAFTNLPLQVWYTPGTPILRVLPGVAFLLGIAFLLLNVRESQTQMLFCWLFAFMVTGGLSESTPAAQRYIAAAPLCALIVGYSLDSFFSLLTRVWERWRKWFNLLLVVVSLAICADDLWFYFKEYIPHSDFGGDNTFVAQRLADYLQTRSNDWQVYFFGVPRMGYASIASLPYLAPHIKGHDMLYPWGDPQNPVPTGDHLIFVFLPGLENDLAGVESDYPGGHLIVQNGRTRKTLYYLYEVTLKSP